MHLVVSTRQMNRDNRFCNQPESLLTYFIWSKAQTPVCVVKRGTDLRDGTQSKSCANRSVFPNLLKVPSSTFSQIVTFMIYLTRNGYPGSISST